MPASTNASRRLWIVVVPAALILAFLPARWCGYGAVLNSILTTLLAPIADPLVAVTHSVRGGEVAVDVADPQQLARQLLEKDNEIVRLRSQVESLRRDNAELQRLRTATEGAIVPLRARVIGMGADASSGHLRINRGSRDGVREGMAVVEGPNLVGRIVQVGPTSSAVEIITARDSLIDVVFTPPVVVEDQLPEARRRVIQLKPDAGELVAGDVDRSIPIQEGDLARLRDPAWAVPAEPVQGMMVGRVVSVRDDPDDPLRKRVRVRPLITLTYLRFVTIFRPRHDDEPRDADATEKRR